MPYYPGLGGFFGVMSRDAVLLIQKHPREAATLSKISLKDTSHSIKLALFFEVLSAKTFEFIALGRRHNLL